jgi:hypothetical protein
MLLIDSMRSTPTNQDHYLTSYQSTSPELSLSRGILLRLDFPLSLMFPISLSLRLPSLCVRLVYPLYAMALGGVTCPYG